MGITSLTLWSRLEPRVRSRDPKRGAEARIRDPLWMLARQWQVGEFQGEDAGSPVRANLDAEASLVTAFRSGVPGQGAQATVPYDPATTPLEALAERQPSRRGGGVDYRQRAEAGLHFLRLLEDQTLGGFRAAVVTAYPLRPKAGNASNQGSERFIRLAAGRAPDGYAMGTAFSALAAGQLPPSLQGANLARARTAIDGWLAWWRATYPETESPNPSWRSERMEHQFAVASRSGSQQTVISAREHNGGRLDWHSFDLEVGATLDAAVVTARSERIQAEFIPTPVDFDGMPSPRFWEMEDSKVDFDSIDAAPDDLCRALWLDFTMLYGNDWFMLPLDLRAGSVLKVTSLRVTDTFGEVVTIPATFARTAGGATPWGMYYLTPYNAGTRRRADQADALFFLPPTTSQALEGQPLEEVRFIRDEMANLAWAIERSVQGDDGRVFDREREENRRNADGAPPVQPSAPGAQLTYRLASSVPRNWIPLVPTLENNVATGAIRLRRGAMLDATTNQPIPAIGNLLVPGTPLLMQEEEVPRAGVHVTRRFEYTRWVGGRSFVWLANRKRAGRGEGSSGLRYDSAEEDTTP